MTSEIDRKTYVIRIRRRLKTMRKFAHDKHGWRLPNNECGRDYLLAFLSQGMTENAARLWVPWCSAKEFEQIAFDARSPAPHLWSSEYLGQLCRMTDAWREQMRRFDLRPFDKTWLEVQQRRRERKKINDLKSRQLKRERHQMSRNIDTRSASAILAIGTSRSWQCVSSLVRIIGGGMAWINKRDGTELTKASLAAILTCVLDDLEKNGVIESKIETGVRGLPTRFVRVKSNVIDKIARSADEIGITCMKTECRRPSFLIEGGDIAKSSPLNAQKKPSSEHRTALTSSLHPDTEFAAIKMSSDTKH